MPAACVFCNISLLKKKKKKKQMVKKKKKKKVGRQKVGRQCFENYVIFMQQMFKSATAL